MARFRQEYAVNGRWSPWVRPDRKSFKLGCCDCGLVHDMDFRISGRRIEFRVARNNRSTGQVRRWASKP